MSGEMATEIDQNIDHTVGDLDDCPGKPHGNPKWLPFKLSSYSKDGNYTWIDDRPSSNGSEIILQNWQTSQPNSLGHVDCVQAKKFEAKVVLDDKRPWKALLFPIVCKACYFFCQMAHNGNL